MIGDFQSKGNFPSVLRHRQSPSTQKTKSRLEAGITRARKGAEARFGGEKAAALRGSIREALRAGRVNKLPHSKTEPAGSRRYEIRGWPLRPMARKKKVERS